MLVRYHGIGNRLGNDVEVRKHMISQGSASSWYCISYKNRARGLEVVQAHTERAQCQASHVSLLCIQNVDTVWVQSIASLCIQSVDLLWIKV